MQKRTSLVKIGFLIFIMGGLLSGLVFAQGYNLKGRQKKEVSEMLDFLEGKNTGGIESRVQAAEIVPITKEKLFSRKREIERLHQENIYLEEKLARVSQTNATLEEKEIYLREKLTVDRKNLSREEVAQLYEELGVAYTQAKVYALAIEAYAMAVKFNPKNPKAHHDLGLLYEHFLGNSKRAVYHLGQYLKLDPSPKDRERVAYLIRILKNKDIGDKIGR